MDTKKVLETLCKVPGVNGMTEAGETAAALLRQYTGEVFSDALGNVRGRIHAADEKAPVVLLEAHCDEIGFVVTGIDDDGFVRVAPCGGIDARVIAACEVTVWGEDAYPGVFSSIPPHLCGKESKAPAVSELGIDVGMTAAEARQCIPLGSRVSFSAPLRALCGDRVTAKALDDRAGVAAILFALEILRDEPLHCHVAVSFSTREEVGGAGSRTATFDEQPQAAVATDVSFACTPDANPEECGVMGNGPMIGWSPALSHSFSQTMECLAKEQNIPYQAEVMGNRTGTDADLIGMTGKGVPTALLSIPLRYMHTPVETISLSDVENTGRLMAAFVREVSRHG